MADLRREALCVRVLWGERRLATHVLRDGQHLSLGTTGEVVDGALAPLQFSTAAMTFNEGLTGEVLRNGETPFSLGEAVHRGLAIETKKGGWSLEIGRADVVRVGRGNVAIEAMRVKAPPRAVGTLDEQVDYRFLNTLLLCLAVFAALAMNAELNVEGELDDSVSVDLTRMRRIVQTLPPPPPPTKVASVSDEKQQPIKRLAAEGKPRPPSKPRADPGGSAQVAARDLVGRVFGGVGASGVLGPGGLGKDLAGALGSVVAVNGDGNGGWSIRGNGAGGPNAGDPIGIGGIPTSGVAKRSGIGKLCSGPGPCKQDIPPTNVTEDPVCSGGGCMDKELIRKVIAGHRDQIRYCYELALQQAPSLAGKVGVKFYVAGNGSVASAEIDQNSTRNDTLSSCLVSRVRTWQFPVGRAAGGYRVTYPFVFRPSGGG